MHDILNYMYIGHIAVITCFAFATFKKIIYEIIVNKDVNKHMHLHIYIHTYIHAIHRNFQVCRLLTGVILKQRVN